MARLDASIALVLPIDPGIDLRADLRIDHVDCDRDVIDVEAGDRVDMIGQSQPICRQTELDVRRRLRNQLEGLEGLFGIGERVAGAGDAENSHLRDCRRNGEHFLRRLLGSQFFTDDAGARLVRAIVFAITIIALDVTRRRNRDMHTRIMMVRLFAIAGMVLDLFPDFGRQIALTRAGTATRLAAPALRTATFMFSDLLHHRIEIYGAAAAAQLFASCCCVHGLLLNRAEIGPATGIATDVP